MHEDAVLQRALQHCMRNCGLLIKGLLAAGKGTTAFEFSQDGHLGAAAPWGESRLPSYQ